MTSGLPIPLQEAAPWAGIDEVELDVRGLNQILDDPHGFIFSDNQDISVRFVDVSENDVQSQVARSAEKFFELLKNGPASCSSVRIISIYSKSSYEPLQITSECMRKLLLDYEVEPGFISTVACFGERPNVAEAAAPFASMRHGQSGEYSKISYKVNYVEQNMRGDEDPWSFRHTAVYHDHRANGPDLFIIAYPHDGEALEDRISQLIGLDSASGRRRMTTKFCQNPQRLHKLIVSTYLGHGRLYLRRIGRSFTYENNRAMGIKPEKASAGATFERVQKLRNLSDETRFLRACCKGNVELMRVLRDYLSATDVSIGGGGSGGGDLEWWISMSNGQLESIDALISRIQNAMDLTGYTLTVHNQLETANVDKELRDVTIGLQEATKELARLAKKNAEDSAKVKVITIVTAIYLPGSVVGTFFGMNFFKFNDSSRGIQVANDVWIFAVVAIPLMLLTAGFYRLVLWRELKRRQIEEANRSPGEKQI